MIRFTHQKGAALLMVLLLIILGTAIVATKILSEKEITKLRKQETQKALLAAKEALIAYAVSDANRPGELPCPDINNDGKIDGVVGNCISTRGWLPWFRLRLGDIRDGYNERLWYALSDSFKPYGAVPPGVPLNSDTNTNITVYGVNPSNPNEAYDLPDIAAVIISPGAAFQATQNSRTFDTLVSGTADDLVDSYLEEENKEADKTRYFMQASSGTFNDSVLIITVDEIMQKVEKRVVATVVNSLESYFSSNLFYPYAESLPGNGCDGSSTQTDGYLQLGAPLLGCQYSNGLTMPTWFEQNGWHRMFRYAFDASCQEVGGAAPPTGTCSGGLTVDGNNTIQSLVIFSGKALGSVSNSCGASHNQIVSRPSSTVCDYLDNSLNYDGDGVFQDLVNSATNNDKIFIIN